MRDELIDAVLDRATADAAANRRKKGSAGGRPPTFDKVGYRDRNCVERCINELKQFRAVAMREKRPRRPAPARARAVLGRPRAQRHRSALPRCRRSLPTRT